MGAIAVKIASGPPEAMEAPLATAGEPAGRISLKGLLLSFLKIGAIGFGGGMAVIALMEREMVRKRRLLGAEE